jgi:4-azaleucine resistance transporter AzlC
MMTDTKNLVRLNLMKESSSRRHSIFFNTKNLTQALRYSFPVFLGYVTIGIAFGLLVTDAGYPWWFAPVMSVTMFAGAAQFIAVGLFAAGTSLWEAALIQLVVNARHIAYGLSMMARLKGAGSVKYYIIFGMTDETFALLSSLPNSENNQEQIEFMFLVTLLDQAYWVLGGLIGAVAGSIIPFNTDGIAYALTSLFIVLMIEQIIRVKKAGIFIVSASLAILCALLLHPRVSLLAAMALSLAAGAVIKKREGLIYENKRR